jgi:hypothetical protein
VAASRAFRFGVSIWGASSRAAWRDKAGRAEAAGFDVLLVADHLVDEMLPPFAAMTAAAEATEHLRVGTLVLNNDFRHQVLVAREATASASATSRCSRRTSTRRSAPSRASDDPPTRSGVTQFACAHWLTPERE